MIYYNDHQDTFVRGKSHSYAWKDNKTGGAPGPGAPLIPTPMSYHFTIVTLDESIIVPLNGYYMVIFSYRASSDN